MKNSIFLLVLLLLALSININSQWQSDVRLTNDSADSRLCLNNARSIASSGEFVHIMWFEARDGIQTDEIYYKRSTDGGISWEAVTRLTNAPAHSVSPSVSVSGQVVHIVWSDNRDGDDEIYYKRSTDGGISWGSDMRLTNNSAISQFPSLSVSGVNVHVVWHDTRNGSGGEIYYIYSTDGGITWSSDMRLTNNPTGSGSPSVYASGSTVHVAWNGNDQINYKRSTDGGISWGAGIPLTNPISSRPSISMSGSVVHVVWEDPRDGNAEIYYKRSTDGGTSWGADMRLTNNPALSLSPSLLVSGSTVHVVWYDRRDGNPEIYYKRSTDGGISWGTDTRLTNNSANSILPSVAISGSVVHTVWQDYRDGNYEIYYKRDPTGNPIGIININTEVPKEFSLEQNYPNPFNPTTKIRFQIPKSGFVNMIVYDILGREVTTLVNEDLKPGTYEADWDASNFPSGVYYYKLTAGDYTETKKMVLVK